MRNPLLAANVQKFGPGPRHQQVVVRGLAAIAAMVKPIDIEIGREFAFDLAGVRIAAGERTLNPSARRLPGPYKTVGDEQVFRRSIPRWRMVRRPEHVAGLCRQRRHGILAAGVPGSRLRPRRLTAREENDILIHHQNRQVERKNLVRSGDGFGPPDVLARITIKANNTGAIMKDNSLVVGG